MKHASIAVVFLLVIVLGVVWDRSRARLPVAAVTAGTLRVQPQTCAECHPGIVEDFHTAPHSNTLRPGDDPEILERFAGHSVEIAGRRFHFTERDGELWFGADDVPHVRRVDWVFGSGHHALTPVSVDKDLQGRPRITNLHISRFADGSFGITPGSSNLASAPPTLGRQDTADQTQRCFGCHVSWLPEQTARPDPFDLPPSSPNAVFENFSDQNGRPGRVDLQQMVPNLDCSRCHVGASDHAASDGEKPMAFDWDALTPLESINRCGECHRRADELIKDVVEAKPEEVVRFAPVGLAMSPCFQVANAAENGDQYPRLDCITCHDPHLPTRSDAEFFNDKCRRCHTSEMHPQQDADFVVTCSQQPNNASCVECHMPKTEATEGLWFTDHWIRRNPVSAGGESAQPSILSKPSGGGWFHVPVSPLSGVEFDFEVHTL